MKPIERVVLKALAKTRERRYQSAGELGKDVSNYLLGKPIRLSALSQLQRRSCRTRKNQHSNHKRLCRFSGGPIGHCWVVRSPRCWWA